MASLMAARWSGPACGGCARSGTAPPQGLVGCDRSGGGIMIPLTSIMGHPLVGATAGLVAQQQQRFLPQIGGGQQAQGIQPVQPDEALVALQQQLHHVHSMQQRIMQQQQDVQKEAMAPMASLHVGVSRQKLFAPEKAQGRLEGDASGHDRGIGTAGSSKREERTAALSPSAVTGPRKTVGVGDRVEAQCLGWGEEWYQGTIREIVSNDEVQILWQGDEPSISNVPIRNLRVPKTSLSQLSEKHQHQQLHQLHQHVQEQHQSQGHRQDHVQSQPQLPPQPASASPESVQAASSLRASAHTFAESVGSEPGVVATRAAAIIPPNEQPPAQDLLANQDSGPLIAATSSTARPTWSYRCDLGPGDDVAAPMANLRRRVEAELNDGRPITITVSVVRPSSEVDGNVTFQLNNSLQQQQEQGQQLKNPHHTFPLQQQQQQQQQQQRLEQLLRPQQPQHQKQHFSVASGGCSEGHSLSAAAAGITGISRLGAFTGLPPISSLGTTSTIGSGQALLNQVPVGVGGTFNALTAPGIQPGNNVSIPQGVTMGSFQGGLSVCGGGFRGGQEFQLGR